MGELIKRELTGVTNKQSCRLENLLRFVPGLFFQFSNSRFLSRFILIDQTYLNVNCKKYQPISIGKYLLGALMQCGINKHESNNPITILTHNKLAHRRAELFYDYSRGWEGICFRSQKCQNSNS